MRELKHLCEQLVITSDAKLISESELPKSMVTTDTAVSTAFLEIPYGSSLQAATDRIIQYGQLVRTQRGGPAYYLMTAFEKSTPKGFC